MKICTIFIAQSIAVLSRTWPGLGLGRPTYDLQCMATVTVLRDHTNTRRFPYSNCYNYCTLMKLLIYFCKGSVVTLYLYSNDKSISVFVVIHEIEYSFLEPNLKIFKMPTQIAKNIFGIFSNTNIDSGNKRNLFDTFPF